MNLHPVKEHWETDKTEILFAEKWHKTIYEGDELWKYYSGLVSGILGAHLIDDFDVVHLKFWPNKLFVYYRENGKLIDFSIELKRTNKAYIKQYKTCAHKWNYDGNRMKFNVKASDHINKVEPFEYVGLFNVEESAVLIAHKILENSGSCKFCVFDLYRETK